VKARDLRASAIRPTSGGLCIVIACTDISEADQVGREALQSNSGVLITYRRAEDLMLNPPSGKAALVILATNDTPEMMGRTLEWLRDRWPHCPITVVGNAGADEYEITARTGGAQYLTRPVTAEEWSAVLSQAQKAASPKGSPLPAPRSTAVGE
jgi:DNA-binding response OmpR family regulator